MKKEYMKPTIVFEDFTLSTNIAAGCDSIVGNPSQGTCGIPGTGGICIFSTPETGCNILFDDGSYDGLCYHVPTEGNNLFNS